MLKNDFLLILDYFNNSNQMFLVRRCNKFLIICFCLIFLPSLFILKTYFNKNDDQQFIQINNKQVNIFYRMKIIHFFYSQILGNKNIDVIERITNLKRKHSIRSKSKSQLIQFSNHPFSLYIHLDFKGAAPKISYLEKLFPLLHRWGVTGICIEYEDMFPFDGSLQIIQHKHAYTKNDIEKINELAKENQLDIMPLLQTYGK